MENVLTHKGMKKEIGSIGEKVANIEDRQRGSKVWVTGVYGADDQNLVSMIPPQESFLKIKKNIYLKRCVRKTLCGLRLSIQNNQHQDLLIKLLDF